MFDFLSQYGDVTKVPLKKELLKSLAFARSRFCIHLDLERQKQESNAKVQIIKAAKDYLKKLKKKSKALRKFLKVWLEMQICLYEKIEGKT